MKFWWIFLVVSFTLVLSTVHAVAPSDLNLTLFTGSPRVNQDLNFQIEWAGSDANVLNWQFNTDGNVIQSGTGAVFTVYDDFTGTGNDPWNSALWIQTVAAGATNNFTILDNNGLMTTVRSGANAEQQVANQDNEKITLTSGQFFELEVDLVDSNTSASLGRAQFWIGDATDKNAVGGAGIVGFHLLDVPGTYLEGVRQDVQDPNAKTARIRIEKISGTDLNITVFLDNNATLSESTVTNSTSVFFWYGTTQARDGDGETNLIIDNVRIGLLSPLDSPEYQNHTFTSVGLKRIEVTVSNEDANVSTFLDLNISGSLDLTIWDENLGTRIPNTSFDFNGDTFTTDANGFISIPIGDLSSARRTISIDINSLYFNRDFIFDINNLSILDLNLLMLKVADGSNRDYQIFQPNETTLITNSFVEWQRTDAVNNGISQRTLTDASALLTFFGQEDALYTLRITDTVANVIRIYNGTIITVLRPLDITDTSSVLTPFSLDVGGLATQSFTGLTSDLNVTIFSDTVDLYTFSVDANADFFGTSTLIQTKGGLAQQDFQPYLVPQTGNLEATIFTINNPEGRKTLTGIRIESRTIIDGVSTLVESKFSDGTGQAVFHFEKGRIYDLSFFEPDGGFIFTKQIEANDTQFFAFIDLQLVTTTPDPSGQVTIVWEPSLGVILPIDGNINIATILSPTGFTIGDINVFATYLVDTNVFFNQIRGLNASFDVNVAHSIPVGNLDANRTITVTVQVFDLSGNLIGTFKKVYAFKDTITSGVFGDARDILGQFAVTLLALIFIIPVIGELSVRATGSDTNNLFVGAAILTFIGMFVGWIPFTDWVAATMIGLGAFMFGVTR